MFILPYKKGSKSAKSLSQSLNAKRLKPNGTKKVFRNLIVNWGNSKRELINSHMILNEPQFVYNAVNKLRSFQMLKEKEIPIPDFTTDINEAKEWIDDEHIVVCRTLLESHSGNGIVIAKTKEELIPCKLYVKYFPKTYEYRVHVFNGEVIDYIQKKKRSNVNESVYNKYIRCHNNGWVFCRDGVSITEELKTLAVSAVNALGLDFGAVDVVSTSSGKSKVLEVNTACALQGTTLDKYVEAIKEFRDEI